MNPRTAQVDKNDMEGKCPRYVVYLFSSEHDASIKDHVTLVQIAI